MSKKLVTLLSEPHARRGSPSHPEPLPFEYKLRTVIAQGLLDLEFVVIMVRRPAARTPPSLPVSKTSVRQLIL